MKINRFTEAEDALLIDCVKNGLNIDEICEALNGRNSASIYFRIGLLLVNKQLQVVKKDITIDDVVGFLTNNNYVIEDNKIVRWKKEEHDINNKN